MLEADQQVVEIEDMVPITQETPPPPEAAPKIPVLSDQIDIVDDEIKIEDNMFQNLEDDSNMGVEIMDYVEEVQEEVVEEEAIPFQLVEEKPSFNGGDANEFSKWVNSKLVYPEAAKENGVQGRVTLQFTVNADGTVSNVKVLRGVDASLDKEAVRVVSSSPKWKPGKQRDRAVKVTYTFPVIFQLR
ncbi:MAG: energy transducer TonB [Candidatus Cryptobacteroides sp.]